MSRVAALRAERGLPELGSQWHRLNQCYLFGLCPFSGTPPEGVSAQAPSSTGLTLQGKFEDVRSYMLLSFGVE